ncbi:MAG: DNA repair protein RecO [Clostridia bacterium]|nr:DNA repair protein RecO [Clostridia bacterium]MDD4386815.1 DNA repair protein RecO [Clostridia bacterium]
MKLIKIKGIVIKEVAYSDYDKIITVLSDEIGTITCMAKGAKRTSSAILASSQYLVYSEFILFKGSTFYHVNSASSISMFYHLKIDFDKLSLVFPLTKSIISLTDENVDTTKILKLFLNALYVLENIDKNNILVVNIFRIKFLCLLGYSPHIINCNKCGCNFKEAEEKIYYDYLNNEFMCTECSKSDKKRYIKLPFACLVAIKYIILSDTNKVFSLSLKEDYIKDFDNFGQAFLNYITHGV